MFILTKSVQRRESTRRYERYASLKRRTSKFGSWPVATYWNSGAYAMENSWKAAGGSHRLWARAHNHVMWQRAWTHRRSPGTGKWLGPATNFQSADFLKKNTFNATYTLLHSRWDTKLPCIHLMNSREESIIEYNDVAVAFLTSKHI